MKVESQPSIAILQVAELASKQEQALAHKLRLSLLNPQARTTQLSHQFLLQYTAAGLSLIGTAADAPGALSVDFTSPSLQRRSSEPLRSQGLGKAIGLRGSNKSVSVLDGTAGLGTDSFLMAAAGCKVTAFEQSDIVFALLADGVHRASLTADNDSAAINRMQIRQVNFLDAEIAPAQYDVVYLDPMFPAQSRSARSKKPMYLLQQMITEETREEEMLERALYYARNRVVVKRARLSPTLAGREPDIQFKGSSSRFDVYLKIIN